MLPFEPAAGASVPPLGRKVQCASADSALGENQEKEKGKSRFSLYFNFKIKSYNNNCIKINSQLKKKQKKKSQLNEYFNPDLFRIIENEHFWIPKSSNKIQLKVE